jgi:hypothetical protein
MGTFFYPLHQPKGLQVDEFPLLPEKSPDQFVIKPGGKVSRRKKSHSRHWDTHPKQDPGQVRRRRRADHRFLASTIKAALEEFHQSA